MTPIEHILLILIAFLVVTRVEVSDVGAMETWDGSDWVFVLTLSFLWPLGIALSIFYVIIEKGLGSWVMTNAIKNRSWRKK